MMNELIHIGNVDISVKEYKNMEIFNRLNHRSIYVAMANDRLIKVGVTMDYSKRDKPLSNAGHGKIIRNFETEKCLNSFEVEREIHKRLDKYRCYGEWYKADFDFVVKTVKELFSKTAVLQKDAEPEKTKAKYRCNTLLDYFHRNEVLINE